jgi:hypothetical protein
MSILRMLTDLDAGRTGDLRASLDTPRPDEDVFMASDRWISTLADQEKLSGKVIAHLEEMIRRQGEEK